MLNMKLKICHISSDHGQDEGPNLFFLFVRFQGWGYENLPDSNNFHNHLSKHQYKLSLPPHLLTIFHESKARKHMLERNKDWTLQGKPCDYFFPPLSLLPPDLFLCMCIYVQTYIYVYPYTPQDYIFRIIKCCL